MVDPDGGKHTYTYDAGGRLLTQQSPGGKKFTFVYDAVGQPTTLQLGQGGTQVSSFDALGRATTLVQLNAAGTPVMTVLDTYDAAGRKTVQKRDAVATTYTYDVDDRLTKQDTSGAVATFTMDTVGNVTVKHHQGLSPVTLSYDAANRLTTVQDGPTQIGRAHV